MRKTPVPKPTKKADKACYDLLHRAWLAGVISDFRYGTDRNSFGVVPGSARGDLGWTVGEWWFPLSDTAAIVEQVGQLVTLRGIESIEWGAPWLGGRRVEVVRTLAAVA